VALDSSFEERGGIELSAAEGGCQPFDADRGDSNIGIRIHEPAPDAVARPPVRPGDQPEDP
jgi:hypothetical protein